ncbi:MAG: hypothetical protein ACYDFT_07335 [Thermoplasmata archaeon]
MGSVNPGEPGRPARDGPASWIDADRALRTLPAGPGLVRLLTELSEEGAESAWTKPALISLFDDAGEAAAAEKFFAEIRELVLAARSIEVERRYAPWAATTAIADLPSATLDRDEESPTPGVWLARWIAVGQRLAPRWESVEPFLAEMAREAPLLGEDTGEPSSENRGLAAFLDFLRATIVTTPAVLPVAGAVGPPDPALFHRYCREVPRGPVGGALRGRQLQFEDGAALEFLRFPTLGELTSRGGQGHLTFHVPPGAEGLPDSLAGVVGSYLARAEPILSAEATDFVARCENSLGRLRERFAPRLVADTLTHGFSPGAGGR